MGEEIPSPKEHLKYCDYLARNEGVREMIRYDCGVFLERAKNAASYAAIYCFIGGVIIFERVAQIPNRLRVIEGRLGRILGNQT